MSKREYSLNNNNREININNLDKYHKEDLEKLYNFGLTNPEFVKNNIEYLNIMETLERRFDKSIDLKNDRIKQRKMKFNDGYIEVGEFKNIILLTDDLSPIGDVQSIENEQDHILNESFNLYNMLEYKKRFEQILLNYCKEGKTYKMIFKVNLINLEISGIGEIQSKTTPSFLIHQHSNIDYILIKFSNSIMDLLFQYNIADRVNINIFIKEWIDSSELKNIASLYPILNKKENSIVSKYLDKLNKNTTDNVIDKTQLGLLGITRKSKSSLLVKGLNYGNIITNENLVSTYDKMINNNYFLNDNENENNNRLNQDNKLLDVKYYKLSYGSIQSNKEYIIKVSNVDNITNEVSAYIEVKENNIIKLVKVEEWIDNIKYNHSEFINKENKNIICIRNIKGSSQKMTFVNNKLENIEYKYNCKLLSESRLDLDKNLKIGTFDFETYLDKNQNAIPYYIGCRTGDKKVFYKYSDYLNVDEMVLKFILDLMVIENHNRFYYAHNLSEFDGMFVLKSLINTSKSHDLKIKVLSKNDGTIISLEIKKILINKKIIKITLLDSLHLLPFSLRDLGKVFILKNNSFYQSETKNLIGKGNFPHDFIQKLGIDKALEYKGLVPDIKYFDNLSEEDYTTEIVNRIKNEENGVWDCEKELLKYLNGDIDTLYSVMYTFGEFIFDKFNINITRIRTYSGLAFLIYTSRYYDSIKKPIFLTTGKIDNYIRNAYYGGIVDSWTFYSEKPLFKYDFKSHYPNQMRNNPMPGGLPIFSTETNLDLIFGFVRAEVIAPSEKELRVAILPIKGPNGELITFRGTVEGTWFSEELKNAEAYGYKIKVKDCLQFEKVYNLFDEFVNEFYNLKTEAEMNKDEISRLIYKLILNSLSGRWGLRDLNTEMKVIESKDLNFLNKTENVDTLFESNRLSLIKSHGPLDPEVVDLFTKENLIETKKISPFIEDKDKPWGKNKSAVQLSAAITAYGRISMSKVKNISDNLYFGGDTDSFILEKPLDSSMIGKKLGQAELEQVIVEAFFHSKKSYLIINDKNETIIKMKGINKPNLKLNYNKFVQLFKGEDIKIKQLEFRKDYKNMNVKIHYIYKTIKGIKDLSIINQIKNKFKEDT